MRVTLNNNRQSRPQGQVAAENCKRLIMPTAVFIRRPCTRAARARGKGPRRRRTLHIPNQAHTHTHTNTHSHYTFHSMPLMPPSDLGFLSRGKTQPRAVCDAGVRCSPLHCLHAGHRRLNHLLPSPPFALSLSPALQSLPLLLFGSTSRIIRSSVCIPSVSLSLYGLSSFLHIVAPSSVTSLSRRLKRPLLQV